VNLKAFVVSNIAKVPTTYNEKDNTRSGAKRRVIFNHDATYV